MNRISLTLIVAVGAIATTPVMAQQNQISKVPPSHEETVPLQLKAAQITQLQQELNDQGFSVGRIDGLWGPNTSAALMNFQDKHGMQRTGHIDQQTMKALGMASAVAASSPTLAQDTHPSAPPSPLAPPPVPRAEIAAGDTSGNATGANSDLPPVPPPATLAQNSTAPTANPPATTPVAATDRTPGTSVTRTNSGANAPNGTPGNPPGTAIGRAADHTLGTDLTGTSPDGTANTGTNTAGTDSNQAIATTAANAPQPAHGANSFSPGEARARIVRRGFQNVSNLRKDGDGVWRGTATKDGQQVQVWLDYKGNVGQH